MSRIDTRIVSQGHVLISDDLLIEQLNCCREVPFLNSMKTFRPVLIHGKLISYVSRKCILPNRCAAVSAIIIFGKIQFLLKSENEFYYIK